jgi:RNA polymerase sigma-70 factor (ECF subfamily)
MKENNYNFLSYYNQFKDKIFNYFLYRVGFDRALAEDLTSEVFIKALKNFSGFDRSKKFQSWIYAIAHNHLVNHYLQSAKDTIPLEVVEDFLSVPDDNNFEKKYEADKVLKVIDTMESNDREVLRLKFIDEMSNQEISEIIGKEEGAVRTQISRSLSKLRGMLDNNLE